MWCELVGCFWNIDLHNWTQRWDMGFFRADESAAIFRWLQDPWRRPRTGEIPQAGMVSCKEHLRNVA